VPVAPANGIQIAYETHGNPDDPAMLLVMGLGCQLILWQEDFCQMLVDRGFHVIRFDNRDVGLSSKIEGGPAPNMVAAMMGDASTASYTLADMANDAAGLLDHLGIAAAHVVGVSMGGMITQQLAIDHPDRVLSIASIMSTTGDREVGQPKPEALPALVSSAPADREGTIEFAVGAFKLIGSPDYPMDEDELRGLVAASYDRDHYPVGFMRQLLGILASPDRTPALRSVQVPALVIHGEADPLVMVSGGEATAAAIPGATLIKVPGMGHDLPRVLWPRFVDAIVENAERAQAPSPAGDTA
jgi:pimeloyl-ACP methyl ester carboxylesterase